MSDPPSCYDRRLSYGGDAVGGPSGRPVWVKEMDGARFVVAVHAGTTGLRNTGAGMSFWSDEVLSAMASVHKLHRGRRDRSGRQWWRAPALNSLFASPQGPTPCRGATTVSSGFPRRER